MYQNDSELSEKRFYCRTGLKTSGFQNEGIAEIQITTYALPKENKELYTKFPNLKEYQGQEGLVATIFLGNFPTAEKIFRLFLEEGEEISFEGCVRADKLESCVAFFEIGEKKYLFCCDVAKYDDKWFLLIPGGYIGMVMDINTFSAGIMQIDSQNHDAVKALIEPVSTYNQ